MSARRFKRKLTPFLCQELLYDYVVGALDAERKQAVEEFLPTDADTQRRLAAIKTGFIYTEKLAGFEIKPSLLKHLSEAESVVQMGQRRLQSANWLATARKSLKISPRIMRQGAAVFTILILIIGVSILPWHSMLARQHAAGNAVELAPISANSSVNVAANGDGVQGEEPESGGDEGDAAPTTTTSSDEEGNDEGIPQDLAAVPAAPKFNVSVPVMNTAPPGEAFATTATHADSSDEVDQTDHKEAAAKGFVYRAFMSLDNVNDVSEEITKKIEDLGGEKAGEVELGWKKGEGRYYHFSMPEANQEKLLEVLRAYGPVRISKDPHPRVMPKGIARIILWIDTPK